MEIGRDSVGILVSLFAFGVQYNLVVAWLEREGYTEGFQSLLVVAGVMGTLMGAAFLIGMEATLLVAACFVASGTPMIVGALWRYAKERRRMADEMGNSVGGRREQD